MGLKSVFIFIKCYWISAKLDFNSENDKVFYFVRDFWCEMGLKSVFIFIKCYWISAKLDFNSENDKVFYLSAIFGVKCD